MDIGPAGDATGGSRIAVADVRQMADAQAGKFDLVAVWTLDRLARSVIHLLATTESLREWGVGLVSLRDAHIDTTTPSGRFVLQILGAVAELERGLIQERVVAECTRCRCRALAFGLRHGAKLFFPRVLASRSGLLFVQQD